MKRIALDTNVVIAILNGDTKIVENVSKYNAVYLPITVCGELLFGASNSMKAKNNLKKFKAFIKACKILNTDMQIAETYASIRLQLKNDGNPIPENDIWIAAICIENKIPIATKDKHFSFVEKLKVVNL